MIAWLKSLLHRHTWENHGPYNRFCDCGAHQVVKLDQERRTFWGNA